MNTSSEIDFDLANLTARGGIPEPDFFFISINASGSNQFAIRREDSAWHVAGLSPAHPAHAGAGPGRGLLSMAFAPDVAASGRFDVYYTALAPPAARPGDVEVDEFRVSATDSAMRKARGAAEVTLETHLQVREDARQLWGFADA